MACIRYALNNNSTVQVKIECYISNESGVDQGWVRGESGFLQKKPDSPRIEAGCNPVPLPDRYLHSNKLKLISPFVSQDSITISLERQSEAILILFLLSF